MSSPAATSPVRAAPSGGVGLARPMPLMARAGSQLAVGILLGILIWLAVVPLVFLLYCSFVAAGNGLPGESGELTLASYVRVLADPSTYALLLTTTVFAVGSTIIGVGVAAAFAWLIERTNIPCRKLLLAGVLVPMVIPNMIYTMSWIQLLSPNNGFLNVVLHGIWDGAPALNVFSLGGMIFIQGISLASHAYLLVAPAFRTIDPSWEEQSAILGKGQFTTLRRVVLPVLKPALFAALVFHFVVAMETFDVPITIGLTAHIRVLSTSVYWATHPEGGQLPDYGFASALSVLLLAMALCAIQLYQRQTSSSRRFVTITGRGYRAKRVSLGVWRAPISAGALLFLVVSVGLPLVILIWRSLFRYYVFPSWRTAGMVGLAAYRTIWNNGQFSSALLNTAAVGLVTGAVCVVLAAAVAWNVVRGSVPASWRAGLRWVAFLPQSLPTVVIGLALIFIYLRLPVPIYGTIWIIALAMITKFVAYSCGALIAAQNQISPDLEAASRLCGAGWARTYRRVVAPLLGPALISCFVWIVIHVIRELALTLMLYDINSQLLSTKVWLLWEGGRVDEAAAVGVLTVAVLVSLMCLPHLIGLMRGSVSMVWAAIPAMTPRPAAARGVGS